MTSIDHSNGQHDTVVTLRVSSGMHNLVVANSFLIGLKITQQVGSRVWYRKLSQLPRAVMDLGGEPSTVTLLNWRNP